MREWFFKNYYSLLNLDPEATKEEVESAFKSYLKIIEGEGEFGPTMEEGEKEMFLKFLKEAYEILTDEKARFFYDTYLIWKKEAFIKFEEKKEIKKISDEISGRFLKEERERMKMSQKEFSLKSCITLKIINAIEEENIELLPPLPYLKGILKEYARALSLPVETVVEGYIKRINEKKKP